MGKEERLRKDSEFAQVREHGKTWTSDLVVLRLLPNSLNHNRYGFVAGKHLGKAVVRNRVKRLLREAVHSTPIHPGWDIVLIARNSAAGADYHRIAGAVTGLLLRARVLAEMTQTKRTGKVQ
jgi:ribonuclease P protein component